MASMQIHCDVNSRIVFFAMKNKQCLETEEITRRLDAILNILLESVERDTKKLSMARRVEILHTAGLRPSQIARILGKTSTYVNVELTRIKGRLRVRPRK